MQRAESNIERACEKVAKERGAKLLKIRGEKGWPDRLLIPHMIFCEFKAPGNELEPLQREIFKRLHDMGVRCYEIDNKLLFMRILSGGL